MIKKRDKQYYELPDPYKNIPPCNVNLKELSRYANRMGKKLCNLSEEEINMFVVHKDKKI